MKKLFASTGVRYAAIAVALLALILTIPATRALADEVLNLFRVQQVTVIPVDFSGLKQLDGPLGQQVSDLISSSMTMKDEPGDLVPATDAADASQKAGFHVRLPQNETFSRLSVQDQAAFDFTIDRTKAQALLDEAGRTDLVLPEDIDGAVVSVTVPASVRVDYGKCPDPKEGDSEGRGIDGAQIPGLHDLLADPQPDRRRPSQCGHRATGADRPGIHRYDQRRGRCIHGECETGPRPWWCRSRRMQPHMSRWRWMA